MKKLFILTLFLLLLAGCDSAPSTPNPAEVSMTMLADQVNANATRVKLDSIFTVTAQVVGATQTQHGFYAQSTGTQQTRLDMEATAEQHRIDAQSTADQARRDAQATQQRIDAVATQAQARLDMESTAEQARLDVVSTQQAAGTSTAFVITQTAIPPANTMTAIAQQQDIALADNQVELSNLEVQQQREKNTPEWVVPFLIAIAATAVGAIYVIRQSRAREFKNGDGEVEFVLLDNKQIVRPQLMPGPIVTIIKDEISMPLLVSSTEQAKIVERDQAVQAIRAMPTATTSNSAQAFNKYFSQPDNLPFDVIDAQDTPPAGLLDGESLKSLDKDWKEAKGE